MSSGEKQAENMEEDGQQGPNQDHMVEEQTVRKRTATFARKVFLQHFEIIMLMLQMFRASTLLVCWIRSMVEIKQIYFLEVKNGCFVVSLLSGWDQVSDFQNDEYNWFQS